MPRITSIEIQPRRKQRRSIFVEQEFYCGVDQEVVARLKLEPGQIVELRDLKQILERAEESRAYERCLRWLDIRARTQQEIAQRLKKIEIEVEVAKRVIRRLSANGLLDDAAFARAYVREKQLSKGFGRQRLKLELRQRGVLQSTIENVLEQETSTEEAEACLRLATKQARIYQRLTKPVARRRLTGFLMRRGYSGQDVYKAVLHIFPEKEEAD